MVCTAEDLVEWEDFPKGLRVLLLHKLDDHATELRSKLEQMDYIVSVFCDENEALSAVLDKSEIFHVAIVEINAMDWDGNFKFPQMAKCLPTIMAGRALSLTTTMKCIALGAVEVLSNPISDDKLHNIWQHVVHRVYNAAGLPRPAEDCFGLEEIPCMSDEQDCSSGNDKYPAPSTPQLKQKRLLDDARCDDAEKDSAEHYEESKSVETTDLRLEPEPEPEPEAAQLKHESVIKEENDLGNGPGNARMQNKASSGPCGANSGRKKMKVDWTPDLHKKFVQAVDQLGIDQAIPSRILELMKVDGLTRHNVASHLQKYRMQRRHAVPKREEWRISPRLNDTIPNSYYYQHNPITAYMHNPMWAQPGPCGPPYQPWPWKSYPTLQAEAWGCPVPHQVVPQLQGSYSYYPQSASGNYNGADYKGKNTHLMPHVDHLADDEVIDKIVREAISKPWLPLPLGLKPPSTESVLLELSKQGISHIPPSTSY